MDFKNILNEPLPSKMEEFTESCKDVPAARKFLAEVDNLAKKYGANFFIVTDGASMTRNGTYGDKKQNPAVKHAREAHIQWESENGHDPYEDWKKDKKKKFTRLEKEEGL